jgi:hypothetical protein
MENSSSNWPNLAGARHWTAEGKSSWDIGMILQISDNTVNFHIKKAMRKLDTTSRTVAVVKAIRLNLIDIPGHCGSPRSM